MFANILDAQVVRMVRDKARQSPRLRANHCFHLPEERLQRMVNIALRDSYFAPHRHEAEGKLEIFTVLSGKVLIALFNDEGEVEDKVVLEAGVGPWQAEIPPFTWHTLAVLSADAVMYEVIDGHYDPATHKRFAPWAPPESDRARGQAYLESLRNRCDAGIAF
jgi:cupin fold WbuC family metalloprotein